MRKLRKLAKQTRGREAGGPAGSRLRLSCGKTRPPSGIRPEPGEIPIWHIAKRTGATRRARA